MASVIGDLLVKLGVDAIALERGLDRAEKRVERFGTQLFFAGTRITAGVTVPVALAGGAIEKFGREFDKAMTESLAIMDDVTPKIRQDMEEVAMSLAETSKFSAKEGAEGYYHLASAGLTAAEAMRALPIAARFAQAGVMDLAKSSEFLAGAQASVYGATADATEKIAQMAKVADVLTQANNMALGTIEDFAQALTNKAGATMRQFNISLESGVAVLAAYASQNIKGRLAGQQFMMMVRDLTTYALKNADAFAKYKIRVFDATGAMRNMADVIADVEKATEGMTDAQITQMLMELKIPQRSIAATRALLGYSDAIRSYEAQLDAAGGTTQRVAEKQMKAMENQLLALWHQVQNVAISLYKDFVPVIEEYIIPALKKGITALETFEMWFRSLPSSVKAGALAFTVLLAAIGPVLTAVGSMTILWSAAMRSMAPLIGMFGDFALRLGLAAGGQQAVILTAQQLVVAQKAAGKAAYANAVAQGATATQAMNAAKAARAQVAATNAANAAAATATARMGVMGRAMQVGGDMLKFLSARWVTWTGYLLIAYPLMDGILSQFGGWAPLLKGIGGPLEGVVNGTKSLVDVLGDLVGLGDDVLSIGQSVIRVLGVGIGQALKGAGSFLGDVWDELVKSFQESMSDAGVTGGKALEDGLRPRLSVVDQHFEDLRAKIKLAGDPAPMQGLAASMTPVPEKIQLIQVSTDALNRSMLDLYDTMKAESEQSDKMGWWDYSLEKVSDLALALRHITREQEDQLEYLRQQKLMYDLLAKTAPNIYPKAATAPKIGITKWDPVKGEMVTGESDDRGAAAWGLMETSAEAFAKAARRAQAEGEGAFQGVGSAAESSAKKVKKLFEELTGTGESDLGLLEQTWSKYQDQLMQNGTAMEMLYKKYVEIRNATGQISPALEEAIAGFTGFTEHIEIQQHKISDFEDAWGSAARNILENSDDFIKAFKDLNAAGWGEEFFKNNASGLDVLSEHLDKVPPELKGIVQAYLMWKATSKEATQAAIENARAAEKAIIEASDNIAAQLADKRDEVALFGDQYGDREIAGLKKGAAKIRVEHKKIIDKMIKDASMLSGQAFIDAMARIKIARQESEEIITLTDITQSHRIAAALGANKKILRNWESYTDEQRRRILEELRNWQLLKEKIDTFNGVLRETASLAKVLGDIFGGSMVKIAESIDIAATASEKFATGLDNWHKAENVGQKISSGIQMATAALEAFSKMQQQVGRGNRALTGALTGFSIGNQILPGWGGAIGALIGGIAGLVMKDPRWKRVQDSWSKKLGFALSEGTAKAIDETAKKFNDDVELAGVINLDKLIADAGGVNTKNFDVLIHKFRDVFSYLEQGKISAQDAMKVISTNFQAFADTVIEGNKIAGKSFVELISLAKRFGVTTKEITDFLNSQMSRAMTGFNTVLQSSLKQFDGMGAKIDEARKKVEAAQKAIDDKKKKGQKPGSGDLKDLANAQKELNDLLAKQKGLAAANSGEIERMGRLILATFNAGIANGLSFSAALEAAGPALDSLIQAYKDLGIETENVALKTLMFQRDLRNAIPELVDGVGALAEAMLASSNLGLFAGPDGASAFADFEAQANAMYERIKAKAIEMGGTSTDALLPMVPMLKAIVEASKEYGFEIDANTQALIDQATKAGMMGDEVMGTNDILMAGFAALIEALGGDVPDAFKAAAQAAKDSADGMVNDMGRVGQAGVDAAGEIGDEYNMLPWKYRSQLPYIIRDTDNTISRIEGMFDDLNIPPIKIPYIYEGINDPPEIPQPPTPPPTATGGVVRSAQVRLVGEAGPEAITPLNDLWTQMNQAYEAGQADQTSGGRTVIVQPGGVQVGVQARYVTSEEEWITTTITRGVLESLGSNARPGYEEAINRLVERTLAQAKNKGKV